MQVFMFIAFVACCFDINSLLPALVTRKLHADAKLMQNIEIRKAYHLHVIGLATHGGMMKSERCSQTNS